MRDFDDDVGAKSLKVVEILQHQRAVDQRRLADLGRGAIPHKDQLDARIALRDNLFGQILAQLTESDDADAHHSLSGGVCLQRRGMFVFSACDALARSCFLVHGHDVRATLSFVSLHCWRGIGVPSGAVRRAPTYINWPFL